MKDIDIIQVPMTEQQKFIDEFTQEHYNKTERFYLAYETDLSKPASVLFENLDWIRKHFSKDGFITKDSLNGGRRNEILNYKKALRRNCPMWELDKFNDDDTVKTYVTDKGETKPYSFYKLSDDGKKQFQKEIDKGEFVLCELIPLKK
jgi:hypothetical protein